MDNIVKSLYLYALLQNLIFELSLFFGGFGEWADFSTTLKNNFYNAFVFQAFTLIIINS